MDYGEHYQTIKMVALKCPKCGYNWDYKGNKKRLVQCPDCRNHISITKSKVKKS